MKMDISQVLPKTPIVLSHSIGVEPISLAKTIVKIIIPQFNNLSSLSVTPQINNLLSLIVNSSEEKHSDTIRIYDIPDIKEIKNTLIIFDSLPRLIRLSNLIFPQGIQDLNQFIKDGCYIIILNTYGVSDNDIKKLSEAVPNSVLAYSDFAYMGNFPGNLPIDDIYYSLHECLMTDKQNEVYTHEVLNEMKTSSKELAHEKCKPYCNIVLPKSVLKMYQEGVSIHDIVNSFFIKSSEAKDSIIPPRSEYNDFGNRLYANGTKVIDLLTTISLNSTDRHIIVVDLEDIYGGELLKEILLIKGYNVISNFSSDSDMDNFIKDPSIPGIIITKFPLDKNPPTNIKHLHFFDVYDMNIINEMISSTFSYALGTKNLQVHNYVAVSKSPQLGESNNNSYDTIQYTKMIKDMNPYVDSWGKIISKSKHLRLNNGKLILA